MTLTLYTHTLPSQKQARLLFDKHQGFTVQLLAPFNGMLYEEINKTYATEKSAKTAIKKIIKDNSN